MTAGRPPVLRDARELGPERRERAAERIRVASEQRGADVRLPPLRYFSSSPCSRHRACGEDPLCSGCGIELRPHQRAGIAWLYLRGRGMLADPAGSGKTPQAAGLLAMCKETGELGEHSRAVIICQPAAVLQWQRELRRMLPEIAVTAVTGSMPRRRRAEAYLAPWEVLVISDRTFAPARNRGGDVETLLQFPVGTVIADDIDALRSHRTQASRAAKRLAARASRRYDFNAEPLHKRVMEVHSHAEFAGLGGVLGTERQFRRNFVRTGQASFYQRAMSCRTPVPCRRHGQYVPGCRACKPGHAWPPPAKRCPECGQPGRPDPTGRTVLRTVASDIGVKNAGELRYLLRPWVLRRTEFGGDGYPEVQPSQVWVELNPAQRERYEELRRHKLVIRYARTGEITREQARMIFTHGAQICSGTAALDEGRTDVSAKLDRVMRMVTGSLEDEKVVVFVYFRENVAALSARLEAAGVGHVVMWSNETGAAERDARIRRFTSDGGCRVLVGTTTIARSLNLQAARHLIAVDTVLNPKMMTQIAGRIRRRGSAWRTVFVHMMYARGTQEEGYPLLLQREQGISDAIWGERGGLFAGLSPQQMMRLVSDGPPAV